MHLIGLGRVGVPLGCKVIKFGCGGLYRCRNLSLGASTIHCSQLGVKEPWLFR